jgi:hypothetical protein
VRKIFYYSSTANSSIETSGKYMNLYKDVLIAFHHNHHVYCCIFILNNLPRSNKTLFIWIYIAFFLYLTLLSLTPLSLSHLILSISLHSVYLTLILLSLSRNFKTSNLRVLAFRRNPVRISPWMVEGDHWLSATGLSRRLQALCSRKESISLIILATTGMRP